MFRFSIVLSCIFLFLGGCTTLSKEQCLAGQWHALGYTDGINGNTPERLSAYNESCAKFGVVTDYKLWRDGYVQGLEIYCSPENGYSIGLNGKHYYGVCKNPEFIRNYQRGSLERKQKEHEEEVKRELEEIGEKIKQTTDEHELRYLIRREQQLILEQNRH